MRTHRKLTLVIAAAVMAPFVGVSSSLADSPSPSPVT